MAEDTGKTAKLHWKCTDCGYTLQGETPPDRCPSCGEECEFVDVTCYTPECGFQGFDTRLGS